MVEPLPTFDALPMDFFRQLYANTDAGWLEVRGIDLKEQGLSPRSVSEWFEITEGDPSYQKAIEYSARINACGYDVFFGVNPRSRGGQEDTHVMRGVSAWADIDGLGSEAAAAAKLAEILTGHIPIRPDAAVFSGGGLHLYHFMKEPYDPAQDLWPVYCRTLKAAALTYDGDLKCVNVGRVLRFPGTLSHKRGERVKAWLNALYR
jgi:hypothetical protein